MSNMERTTSWQQIQLGVKEAERLIVRKEYNLVMVKARQVLEYMVRCMAERACVVEGDLSDTIDQLYEGQWINKATKDNYHTIRILGNKAVHEGDDAAYDANQAYQLLTQEVYVFANEFAGGRSSRPSQASRGGASRQPARTAGSGGRPGSGPRGGRGTRSQGRPSGSGGSRQGAPRKKKRRRVSPVYYVWRLLIPVLAVVLLIVVIQTLGGKGGKDKDKTTTAPTVTTAATEPAPTPPPEPETEPETEPPAVVYRIKGNSVNVRKEPSTDSRILVQLSNGYEVDSVKRYSNDWDVINYEGQEAYVSSRFLEKVEPVPETEVVPTGGDGAEGQ